MIDSKICKICNENKDTSQFYKNKSNKDGLHSYCKDCAKKKSMDYQKEHTYWKKAYEDNKDFYKAKAKRWANDNKEYRKEIFKNWQRENKDKIKKYQKNRKMHKNHDISDEELQMVYEYSNHSCMYCGISENEAIEKYNQKLHKDHAYNNGSDGIDNCVLACKGCNSSKHDKDWDKWFIKSEHYNEGRYGLILDWLNTWK